MAERIPANFRRVITAAAGGNVIEWYDFYIFGSLATILSVKFFEKSHPVAALLSTIALFTAGFLVRPLGAFVFGWLGDMVGRKYTFILTLVGMALGTGAIGLIPTYRSDRPERRVHPVRLADDPGSLPGRLLRRRHHLCRRARAGRAPRLLYRLVADLADPGNRAVAHRDHRDPRLLWRSRVQRLGVADSVPVLLPAGVRHHVHAGQLRGVAGLRGDQGQGAHQQKPVARGLPQSAKPQIRCDRHHRGIGRGRGLVLEPVLGAVLPADGFQGGHAHQLPHRGNWAGHRDPDTHPVRLAV